MPAKSVIDPTHHLQRLKAGTYTPSVGAAYLKHALALLAVKHKRA